MNCDKPLVSVVIVTYNSMPLILDTLNSIKVQTYDNIELIVSDDNSTDETVTECQRWMEENKERFVHCEVITTSKNTGVAPNANRGVRKCHGEWIKVLGGDDLFLPTAIEDVMSFVTPEMDVVVSQYYSFVEKNGKRQIQGCFPSYKLKDFYEGDNKYQKEHIPYVFVDATIGYFIRKKVFDSVGGYEERYPMIEDVPMFFKLVQSGYKLHLFEKPCFLYRIAESITHVPKTRIYNIRFKESSLKFHREVRNKYVPWWNIVYHQSYWMTYLQFHLIVKLAHNRNNHLAHFIKTAIYYLTIESYIHMIKGH